MAKPDIKIRFTGISVLSKSMNEKPKVDFNKEMFNYEIEGQTLVKPEIKTLISILNIKIREPNKENVLAAISIGCEFQLENFEDVMPPPENNVYKLPVELDVLIKTMSISTARGIMYSEFKGTYLNKAILPIIFLPTVPPNPNQEKIEPKNEAENV